MIKLVEFKTKIFYTKSELLEFEINNECLR